MRSKVSSRARRLVRFFDDKVRHKRSTVLDMASLQSRDAHRCSLWTGPNFAEHSTSSAGRQGGPC
jgi:hypothetical protein